MLGEAYVKCGRHNAGLKALQHALQLDPRHWIALYHVADIHAQLANFEQAIETYGQVLAITGDQEIGVVSAMANTELALGRQAAAGGFRERSRRAFHASLDLAHKVLKQGLGHRPWAWKVIGDAAFELASHESTVVTAEETSNVLRPILEHLVEDDVDRRSSVEGLGHAANLLQSAVDMTHTSKTAIFAYAYRAHLLKNQPRVADPALYDLASALHALGNKVRPDSAEKTACMKGAIAAIRLALERDAGDERLWNALGVICGKAGAQMAQHAFVVSLELYQKVRVLRSFHGRHNTDETGSGGLDEPGLPLPEARRPRAGQSVLPQGPNHGSGSRTCLARPGHAGGPKRRQGPSKELVCSLCHSLGRLLSKFTEAWNSERPS